jgi:hypothetical protein
MIDLVDEIEIKDKKGNDWFINDEWLYWSKLNSCRTVSGAGIILLLVFVMLC